MSQKHSMSPFWNCQSAVIDVTARVASLSFAESEEAGIMEVHMMSYSSTYRGHLHSLQHQHVSRLQHGLGWQCINDLFTKAQAMDSIMVSSEILATGHQHDLRWQ